MNRCLLFLKFGWLNVINVRANLKVFLIIYGAFILICFFGLRNHFGTIKFYNDWYSNKSHYAKDYVFPDRITTLNHVESPCSLHRSPFILIVVCSSLKNRELRQSIRETWALNAKDHNIHVFFLVGRSTDSDLDNELMEESLIHEDVIIENFIDSYHNLTIKSIMMLKWIKNNCPNAQFMMKIDDDVYLNLPKLIAFVKSDQVKSENFSIGKLYTRERPHRDKNSKWYIPEFVYPRDMYPHYLSGVGYLASTDAALKLYEESFNHPLIYLEDVFILGICAENIGLKRKDYIGFRFFEHPVKVECNSIHPHMILLSHYLNAQEMRRIHNEVLSCDVSDYKFISKL